MTSQLTLQETEYKETELGWFPKDWEVIELGNLSRMIVPQRNKPKKFDGNTPWIRIEDFEGKYIARSKSNRTVSEGTIRKMHLRPYPIGTVLCSCSGNMGICAITKEVLVSNQTFIGIVPNQHLNADYLYYLLGFYKRRIEILGTGVTILYVSKNKFKTLKIPLPPLAEQRKIAFILSMTETAIEKTDSIINSLKTLKKSLMKHLFTYGAVSLEEIDRVIMKETEIGEVPDHWVLKKMIDFATFQRGKDLPKSKRRKGKYPVVGSGGIIGYHDKFVCDGPGLITGRSGSIGTLTYVEGKYWPHNTGLYVKDFHSNYPKYVYYFLHSFDFKKYATGVSVPTLNRNFIHSEIIKVPPLTEQKQIASILSSIDVKIDAEENKKKAISELFKSLLQNLMTAKVRVNNFGG